MPFSLISPGVAVLEEDLSEYVPAISTSTGAYVGAFPWGIVDKITTQSNEESMVATYGKPTNDAYRSFLECVEFLGYSTSDLAPNLKVVRVVGSNAKNAVSGGIGSGLQLTTTVLNGIIQSVVLGTSKGTGYVVGDIVQVTGGVTKALFRVTGTGAAGAVSSIVMLTGGTGYVSGSNQNTVTQGAVLVKNDDDFADSSNLPEIIAKYPGSIGNSLMLSTARASEFDNWRFKDRFVVPPSATVKKWSGTGNTATFPLGMTIPGDGVVTVDGVVIKNGTDPGQWQSDVTNLSFVTDVESFTINAATNTTNKFTLANTDNISTNGAVVKLATIVQPLYTGVGNVPHGYARVDGNSVELGLHRQVFSGDGVTSTFTISGNNTVAAALPKVWLDGVAKTVVSIAPANAAEVQVVTASSNTNITFHASSVPGIGIGNISIAWGYPANSTALEITYGYPQKGVNNIKVFTNQTEVHAVVADYQGKWVDEPYAILERYENLSLIPGTKRWDGEPLYYVEALNRKSRFVRIASEFSVHTDKVLSGGVDDNTFGSENGVTPGIIQKGFSLFKDGEVLDISHIIVPGYDKATFVYVLANIAEFRRDCVVYYSPPFDNVVANRDLELTSVITTKQDLPESSYYHMDCNWKYVYDKYNDKYRWVACAADSAGCYALTHMSTEPWFSGAGFNRGKIKNAVKLAWSPNKTQRDELYANFINPISHFLNRGPVLFGDKTGQVKPSAFDRMNVRWLFIVLEKAIAEMTQYYLFEHNTQFTRNRFINTVTPFLREVQGRFGIEEFKIQCDEKNNPPSAVARKEFHARILINPVDSINFAYLTFTATNGTVSFDEIINSAN